MGNLNALRDMLSEIVDAARVCRDVVDDLAPIESGIVNYHWSSAPGEFLDKVTGGSQWGPVFSGTTREWYETLVETIVDLDYQLRICEAYDQRRAALSLYCSEDAIRILETSVLWRSHEDRQFPALRGELCRRYGVIYDPNIVNGKIALVVVPSDWRLPRFLGGTVTIK